jgi:hypothetical protein
MTAGIGPAPTLEVEIRPWKADGTPIFGCPFCRFQSSSRQGAASHVSRVHPDTRLVLEYHHQIRLWREARGW